MGKYDALLGQFWWSEYAQGQFDEYVVLEYVRFYL